MKTNKKEFQTVGKFSRRRDGQAKAEGKEVYISDLVLPNMWFGKVLRSLHPHARVRRIDTSREESMVSDALKNKSVYAGR